MTIKNGPKFSEWAKKAGLKGDDRMPIFKALDAQENSDAIILQACPDNGSHWTIDQMKDRLGLSAKPQVGAVSQPQLKPQLKPILTPDQFSKPDDRVGVASGPSMVPSELGAPDLSEPAPVELETPERVVNPNLRSEQLRRQRQGAAKPAEGGPQPKKAFGKPSMSNPPVDGSSKWLSKKNILLVSILVVVLALVGVGVYLYSTGALPSFGGKSDPSYYDQDFESANPGGQDSSESTYVGAPPEAPSQNPLNFKGSVETHGFLGEVQKLVFIIGLGILGALVGDIVYRKQWVDGITAVLGSFLSIVMLFPPGTAVWVGAVFFFRELYLIWLAAFQGGRDYSPMAAYFLLVGLFGGLIFTRIGVIQNIFPGMVVTVVPPIVDLGYSFQTFNFVGVAFPLVVYIFVIFGFLFALLESVRPSGEDKSSRVGSLISAGVGLLAYALFLHAIHLAPWICFMVAMLVSAGGSAALRSEPAKQFVTPIYGVRSPFDGAMLLAAFLLVLVVIFGQQWWLVGLL